MRVTPTGQSEYHDGHEVLRYGRVISENETLAVWYHSGLYEANEPAWAMDTDVEWQISVSVDTILVCSDECTLYAIDRDAFSENVRELGGKRQCIARASDPFVSEVGDPNDHLRGELWIESGNQVDEGYHKRANEA
jgi:hypothetical protein